MRIVTCVGDATSISAHGGLPYHLLEAGKRAGFIDGGWKLEPEAFRLQRLRWNAARAALRGEWGGYQYSTEFLQALVKQVPPESAQPDEIISIFPLLPPARGKTPKVSFYIDATLLENFEDYGIGAMVGRSMLDDALRREEQAYGAAERIICRSTRAAKVVVESYGIEPQKVHVVPGGANILECSEPPPRKVNDPPLRPVRLGFIGKDWQRKNLPFVLQVADSLQARGRPTEVIAAGFEPKKGPRHARLQALGFLDKRLQRDAFISLIRSCHFTCLFSRAEAFGLANRESLRLGVPVLASNVGGIPDTMPNGCGHLFEPHAEAGDVADAIETYIREPDRYWTLRDGIERRSREFTWDAAIEKMQAIWAGSHASSYERVVGQSD